MADDSKNTKQLIAEQCDKIKQLLLVKNKAYGNSALNPLRIFSRAKPDEAILVRIDDKLSRIARGEAAGEDVILDLIGYLILLRVYRKQAKHYAREDKCQWSAASGDDNDQ